MAEHRIEIDQHFSVQLEQLFAHLSEHENLAKLFAPAQVRRLQDGQAARNGIGSTREVRVPFAPPFVETVTAYRENELLEYRITQGSALIKNHLGSMRFSSNGDGGSRLHYTIVFEGKFPWVGALIRSLVESSIRRGLKNLRC